MLMWIRAAASTQPLGGFALAGKFDSIFSPEVLCDVCRIYLLFLRRLLLKKVRFMERVCLPSNQLLKARLSVSKAAPSSIVKRLNQCRAGFARLKFKLPTISSSLRSKKKNATGACFSAIIHANQTSACEVKSFMWQCVTSHPEKN